jgi:hypothetical protein
MAREENMGSDAEDLVERELRVSAHPDTEHAEDVITIHAVPGAGLRAVPCHVLGVQLGELVESFSAYASKVASRTFTESTVAIASKLLQPTARQPGWRPVGVDHPFGRRVEGSKPWGRERDSDWSVTDQGCISGRRAIGMWHPCKESLSAAAL